VARIGALCSGPFGSILLFGACCRSSVVEHSIGNGEVDSSILSGSTSFSLENPFKISTKQRFRLNAGFGHFSYLGRNRPRKRVSTDTKLAQRFAFCPCIQIVLRTPGLFRARSPWRTRMGAFERPTLENS
jgi:hypothetical protein